MPECTGTNGLPNATVTSNGTDPLNVTKNDEEDVLNGAPYCITGNTDDTFSLRGGTCSEAPRAIEYVIDFTGLSNCRYSRLAAITGTFRTHAAGDATATLIPGVNTEFQRVEGILCAAKVRFGMTITLETDKTTAEPLYVS